MAPVVKVLRLAVGWLLILLGLIGLFLPVVPQIPFLAVGALLLAPYVRVFRRVSAWFHRRYPSHRPWMRHFRVFKRRPPASEPATAARDNPPGED